jgi:hypothetical protein
VHNVARVRGNERLVLPAASSSDVAESSIFFVGTATVILRHAGFTLLTDPNFLHAGDHVHLGYGITSRRVTEPAISLEELCCRSPFLVIPRSLHLG